MRAESIRRYLVQDLHPAWVRLHQELLGELEAGYSVWAEANDLRT